MRYIDAVFWVQFGLSGDGKLLENQGTSAGSSYVQLYNGRAIVNLVEAWW